MGKVVAAAVRDPLVRREDDRVRTVVEREMFGTLLSAGLTRRVWLAVTREPLASVREIGDDLDIGYSTVAAAIRHLEWLGYIEIDGPGLARARRVVVPFLMGEVKRRDAGKADGDRQIQQ